MDWKFKERVDLSGHEHRVMLHYHGPLSFISPLEFKETDWLGDVLFFLSFNNILVVHHRHGLVSSESHRLNLSSSFLGLSVKASFQSDLTFRGGPIYIVPPGFCDAQNPIIAFGPPAVTSELTRGLINTYTHITGLLHHQYWGSTYCHLRADQRTH